MTDHDAQIDECDEDIYRTYLHVCVYVCVSYVCAMNGARRKGNSIFSPSSPLFPHSPYF